MEEGNLVINWMNLPPAPDSEMELAYCSGRCKRHQCGNEQICSCLQNNVPCTDLYKCARNNCCNITGRNAIESDSDDDTDDDGSGDEVEMPMAM